MLQDAPPFAGLVVTVASVGIGVILMGYVRSAFERVRAHVQDRARPRRMD